MLFNCVVLLALVLVVALLVLLVVVVFKKNMFRTWETVHSWCWENQWVFIMLWVLSKWDHGLSEELREPSQTVCKVGRLAIERVKGPHVSCHMDWVEGNHSHNIANLVGFPIFGWYIYIYIYGIYFPTTYIYLYGWYVPISSNTIFLYGVIQIVGYLPIVWCGAKRGLVCPGRLRPEIMKFMWSMILICHVTHW